MSKNITKKDADHIVARISGVTEGESKYEAAMKVIDLMRRAGMPRSAIKKAELIAASLPR